MNARLLSVSRASRAAVATSAAVLAVLACSDSSGGGSGTAVPEGGTLTADGAIVGPDGEVLTPPTDGPQASKVNATDETVMVAGATREYTLVVPKTYVATRKYPLVLGLHGDGQDGPGFREHLQLDNVAGDDAIVAYPTARPEWDLFTAYDQNPDQQLIAAVIDAVKAKMSIDAAKIWAIGYSKGGFVANQIACRKPGLLKAMANHASGAPQEPQGGDGFPTCPGVVGLPTMATEGQFDKGIGGYYGASYWAKINGCGTGTSATTPAPCQKFDGCPADKKVLYCEAAGVSHYPIWGQAAQVSWAFLTSL